MDAAAKNKKDGQNVPSNGGKLDGGTSTSAPIIHSGGTKRKAAETLIIPTKTMNTPPRPPPPQIIDPSKLEINSRILLKNKDDDVNNPELKEAIVKKLYLNQSPPQLRVHVDGKRKGILDTIGLEDIHSIIGLRRNSSMRAFDRMDSTGSAGGTGGGLNSIGDGPLHQPPLMSHQSGGSVFSNFGEFMALHQMHQPPLMSHYSGGSIGGEFMAHHHLMQMHQSPLMTHPSDGSNIGGELMALQQMQMQMQMRQNQIMQRNFQQQQQQQQQQQALSNGQQPLITSEQYHTKFCLPRRKKRLRQQQQQQQQQQQHEPLSGVQQFNVPTFGDKGLSRFSRRNTYNSTPDAGTRMIMDDLLMLQNNTTTGAAAGLSPGITSGQQLQQPATPGGGGDGSGFGNYPYGNSFRDSFRNSFALPFGGADAFGIGGGGGFSRNASYLMSPFRTTELLGGGVGGEKKNDTTSAAANGTAGLGAALPQSAFSALDSLAPELRERMLRMAKLAEPEEQGKKDITNNNDAKEAEKKKNKKKGAKNDEEEGGDNNDEDDKKKKYKPSSTRKKKRIEKKPSDDGKSLVSGDNSSSSGTDILPRRASNSSGADVLPRRMSNSSGAAGGTAAALPRRTTDFTAYSGFSLLSPTSFKPESIFGMRNSMMDGGALSLGSGGGMREVLGPSGMISGGAAGGVGSGVGNYQDRINMMQLMSMNPPPFGGLGGGAMRPPVGGGGVGGGYNPIGGSGFKRKSDPSLSLDVSNSTQFDAEAKNQMMAALESLKKKFGKKDDDTPPPAVGSGLKRKESSSSAKKNSSGKKKKKKTKKVSTPRDTSTSDGEEVVEKPKRPFSAYNLFFQLEREFIMATISGGGNPREDPLIKIAVEAVEEAQGSGEGNSKGVLVEVDMKKVKKAVEGKGIVQDFDINVGIPSDGPPPVQIEVPPRYKHLNFEDHWYCVSRKVKRKHRKTEGGCGFLELTKMVSSRWKTVECTDPQVKEWCQKVADQQLEIYKRDMKVYKKWLANHPPPDDEEDDSIITIDETKDYTPPAGRRPSVQTSMPMGPPASTPMGPRSTMTMGLTASPFDYGKMQHSFFDPKMSDMGRFSDLSNAARMAGNNGMMMPPGPIQSLPPPPFSSSLGLGERLKELGGQSMDETERRFAALAEQETRRRIQSELQMSSFMRPPQLGNGFGSLGGSMGVLGDSGIGGFSSAMPPMNQGNMPLSNEEMMAQIMRMKNDMTNENGLGQGAAGGLPQPPFGLDVGQKKGAADEKSDSDGGDNDKRET